MANNKRIKKINLGGTEYDVFDAATAQRAEQNVNSINGYSYEDVNSGKVQFANVAIEDSEITGAVDGLGNK
jgi:hypothetical protein